MYTQMYSVWFSFKNDPLEEKHFLTKSYTKEQAEQLVKLYEANDRFNSGMVMEG